MRGVVEDIFTTSKYLENIEPTTNNWYLLVQTNLIQSLAMNTLEDSLASVALYSDEHL